MIKKYFPHIFISTFAFFLLFLGVFSKNNDVIAIDAKEAMKKKSFYESKFQTFEAKTTKETKIVLSNIKQKIVIINFWASWCRPCIGEFKSLNKLQEEVGKESLFILGVNNDSENYKKEIVKIENKYNLSFESIADLEYDSARLFGVTSIPTTFIYVNKKLYKIIDTEFDFSDKSFIKELKSL